MALTFAMSSSAGDDGSHMDLLRQGKPSAAGSRLDQATAEEEEEEDEDDDDAVEPGPRPKRGKQSLALLCGREAAAGRDGSTLLSQYEAARQALQGKAYGLPLGAAGLRLLLRLALSLLDDALLRSRGGVQVDTLLASTAAQLALLTDLDRPFLRNLLEQAWTVVGHAAAAPAEAAPSPT